MSAQGEWRLLEFLEPFAAGDERYHEEPRDWLPIPEEWIGRPYVNNSPARRRIAPVGGGEFVQVPREPTPKMIAATWDHEIDKNGGIESQNTRNARIYRAMLAAAPAPTEGAEPALLRELRGLEADFLAAASREGERGNLEKTAMHVHAAGRIADILSRAMSGGQDAKVLSAADQASAEDFAERMGRLYPSEDMVPEPSEPALLRDLRLLHAAWLQVRDEYPPNDRYRRGVQGCIHNLEELLARAMK